MERSLNHKVYINPNFNRKLYVDSIPQQTALSSTNKMHVNPNFARTNLLNNFDHNVKRRIFVNPNFIKPEYSLDTTFSSLPKLCNETKVGKEIVQSNICDKEIESCNRPEIVRPVLPSSVSKSRYTLIRKIDSCPKNVEKPSNKGNSTVKISKYKTVRLSYITNNLTGDKLSKETKILPAPVNINHLLPKVQSPKTVQYTPVSNKKFKKINIPNQSGKKLIDTKKNWLNSRFQINRKSLERRFKKNNIPCPLFRKYGKCLRNIHGNCEFLHDKKHVSICRKFLKGICHDISCSFSHELSAKKMPTCYFYLKGLCTKENCPYLHVKLNSKAKLCNDFLKGYCEKGDKCIYRHVNKELQTRVKRSLNLQRQYSCSSSSIIVSNKKIKRKQSLHKRSAVKRRSVSKTPPCEKDINEVDCRYFKESKAEEVNEDCNVIKPNRCRLGTLPSFIKL